MKTFVFIDNIIAGGKTTLICELIKRNPEWAVIDEGVDFEIFSQSFSTKSKEDIFMANVYTNYLKAFSGTKSIILVDRTYDSVYRWAFMTNTKPSRFIRELTADIQTKLNAHKCLCISLEDFNLSTTLENIKLRGRDFEQHYTKESLIKLKESYNNTHFPGFSCHATVTFEIKRENYINFPFLAEAFINKMSPPPR